MRRSFYAKKVTLNTLNLGVRGAAFATVIAQALGNKLLPVAASVVELIGKFVGAFLLSKLIGYFGICLTEPITWIACTPVVLVGCIHKMKKIKNQ